MFDNLPPVTKALLLSNGAVFLLQLLLGNEFFLHFMLWPLGDYPLGMGQVGNLFLPWQLATYGFLHGNFAHLFFNMLALFMFGAPLEYAWGQRRFSIFFFTCVIGAGVIQLIVGTMAVQQGFGAYPTIGASGGVYGLLLGYGMLFPRQRVMLLFPPIPMQARTLVIIFGALALFLGITGTQQGVAHFAHLGGMLFGFLLIQYWRGRWPFNPPRGRGGPWRPH